MGSPAEDDYSSDMPTEDNGLTNDYRTLQKDVDIWLTSDDTVYYDDYECYEANNETECESGTTSVQRTYFLGLIESTTAQGKIGRAFACGIENGTPFCLEGYDPSKYSDDDNVGVLNTIFPECGASASNPSAFCSGSSVGAGDYAYSNVCVDDAYGTCDVYYEGYCYVSSDGDVYCG